MCVAGGNGRSVCERLRVSLPGKASFTDMSCTLKHKTSIFILNVTEDLLKIVHRFQAVISQFQENP